jgi:hypothetical protein
MRKIAITLSPDQFRAIERIRRKQGIPRSRVIQRALTFYLSQGAESDAARAYDEGYRRHPERTLAATAYEQAAAEVLGVEDWS